VGSADMCREGFRTYVEESEEVLHSAGPNHVTVRDNAFDFVTDENQNPDLRLVFPLWRISDLSDKSRREEL